MRLALLGAFPFPSPQGSQVYVGEQARALRAAGATCSCLSYASLPPGLAPRSGRSGPSPGKPLADAALLAAFVRACRRQRFDAVLAHNAEAAVVAILGRPLTRVPVVYVAHTILRYELSAYGPAAVAPALDRVGHALDGWIARRADGILALSEDARRLLVPAARCEIAVVPPGLELRPDPDAALQGRVCQAAGVTAGGFALYAGNLDRYQDLELLDAAAARLGPGGPPVVVATHDARDGAARLPHLRIVELGAFDDIRALQFAAGSLVLARRRPGGFPIKLLNYLEAGRPVVAFARIAPGLVDGVHGCLLPEGAGAGRLAESLRELAADPERADALGRAARQRLLDHHCWPRLAHSTLTFVDRVRTGSGGGAAS